AISAAAAFVALPSTSSSEGKSTLLCEKREAADDEKQFSFPNPLAELADMWQSFDDIVDDFFNKRMGNGEQFYGKRKYKPSGKYSEEYNGYGLSDFRKIEAAKEFREERARMKEERLSAEREKNLS
ncbi:hypothetical protein ACHAWC_003462, partial [Mediolabrus comicus]